MKTLGLLLGILLWATNAHAAQHGSCSPYLPGPIFQSLGITNNWTTGGTALVPGAVAAPISGCQPLGATVTDDTSTGSHYAQNQQFAVSMPQGGYTLTAWVKRVSGADNAQILNYFNDGLSESYANVDLGACSINSTGSSSSMLNPSATAVLVGGYCKVSLSYLTANPETAIIFALQNLNGSFATNYTGTGASNAYWGLDLRPTTQLTILDQVNYYSQNGPNGYGGFIFSSGGTENTPNQISIYPATFPNNATMSWNLNPTFDCGSVCVTLFEFYGLYDGNYQDGHVLPPKQVSNITTATGTSTLAFNGVLSGYDVIYDTFLSTTSAGSTFVCEIEVFLHINPIDIEFVGGLTEIGTTTISGIPMTVYFGNNSLAIPDYVFLPTAALTDNPPWLADPPNGTVMDLKAMNAYLVAHGKLTGSEWFNGFGLLAEVWGDKGQVTVTSFVGVLN